MTAFCPTKFQRVPSLMPFTFTGGPHLSGLEMSLGNILLIGLFCSNNKMVIFSETENSSQQTCKGPYIYDVHMEGGWSQRGGRVSKSVTCLQILMVLNSIIRGSSFFFNVKPTARHILTTYITIPEPLAPNSLFSPLHLLYTKSTCYLQSVLIFLCEKIFGLSDIASWLASSKPF